jgi:exportin-7
MDPNQLAQVESLAAQLYTGSNETQRNEAQQQLLVLQTSIDYIPQCQYILDHSKLMYAHVIAASSLELLVTQFWTNFTVEQKVEIKTYVLNYLANNVAALDLYVIGSITKLLCRVTKLGWFDSPVHREILDDVTKFLEATVIHNIVGLKILHALVEEMNVPTTNSPDVLHLKTAVSFRDQCLFQAFQIGITTIRQIETQPQALGAPSDIEKMETLALQLTASCLQFDFMGTNPEESAEDVGTVQVPGSWSSIVADSSVVVMLFRCYASNVPPRSNIAMQCLVQITSIRRSLFPSERERGEYLLALMSGMHNVLKNQLGLGHEDNYHEFCRFLSRMKSAYQLSEMIRSPLFNEVIELTSAFTVQSFANWSMSMNSIQYLLAYWGRMVAALPFLRTDTGDSQRQLTLLRHCVLQVTEAYITAALATCEAVHKDGIDDPFADEGSFKEQMDKLPLLVHLQYEAMVINFISPLFEQQFALYQQLLESNNSLTATGALMSSRTRMQTFIVEDRLAWLVYITAAIIGNPQQSLSSSMGSSTAGFDNALKSNQIELICDGRLCRYVFQLLSSIDFRMRNSRGEARCRESLELALLAFFRAFKKSYLIDAMTGLPATLLHAGSGAGGSGSSSSSTLSFSNTPVHPLLSLALSTQSSSASAAANNPFHANGDDSTIIGDDGVTNIASIYESMNLGDQATMMNNVVNKLCTNIQYWQKSEPILLETLAIFSDMVSAYTSSKAFLELESVRFIVNNHTGQHFPFLGYNSDNKFRIQFYSTLARLVFTSAEDQANAFDTFVAPNVEIVNQLQNTADLHTPMIRTAVIGALRDLRGITSASINKRTYNLLFEVLYPHVFHLMARVTDVWCEDYVVMTAVLKFLHVSTLVCLFVMTVLLVILQALLGC